MIMYLSSRTAPASCRHATQRFDISRRFFTGDRSGLFMASRPCQRQANVRWLYTVEKCTTLSRNLMPTKNHHQSFAHMKKKTATFSSRTNETRGGTSTLSRTERRLLERKRRNRAKKQSRMPKTDPSPTENTGKKFWRIGTTEGLSWLTFKSQRFKNIFESLVPKVPGRNIPATHRSLWMALGMRMPFFLAVSYLITDENTSPYVVQGSLGPSMLPTIQFVGDIWMVETGAWDRAWSRAWSAMFGEENEDSLPPVESIYKVGDLVIWEDPETGKRSCKRVIGLAGDTVHRFGEYRNLYRNRSDFGILWPKNERRTDRHAFNAHSTQNNEEGRRILQRNRDDQGDEERSNKIIVPKQCVWLEGDCPLFSMDSRYVKNECSLHHNEYVESPVAKRHVYLNLFSCLIIFENLFI